MVRPDGWESECMFWNISRRISEGIMGRGLPVLMSQMIVLFVLSNLSCLI